MSALELLQGAVLGLHLISAHTAGGLQGVNPGVYLRTESGFTAGAFRNSYDRGSAYAGWTFETPGRALALTLGGVTGYDGGRVSPLVVPSVRLGLGDHAALRLSYLPRPPAKHNQVEAHGFDTVREIPRSDALHLSVEWGF